MSDKRNSRREFLRSFGRYISASAVVAGSVAVASRAARDRSAHRCTGNGVCRGCPVLRDCLHPTAFSARKHGV